MTKIALSPKPLLPTVGFGQVGRAEEYRQLFAKISYFLGGRINPSIKSINEL
jgi:hypothetical protein